MKATKDVDIIATNPSPLECVLDKPAKENPFFFIDQHSARVYCYLFGPYTYTLGFTEIGMYPRVI